MKCQYMAKIQPQSADTGHYQSSQAKVEIVALDARIQVLEQLSGDALAPLHDDASRALKAALVVLVFTAIIGVFAAIDFAMRLGWLK